MTSADDLIARAERDMQRSLRDAAKHRGLADKAEADAERFGAFLAVARGYTGAEPGTVIAQRKRGGKIDALLNACKVEIVTHGSQHVPNLLEALGRGGLEVGGDNPRNRLAGYLSKSPDFIFDSRTGWHYIGAAKTIGEADTPQQETSASPMIDL